MNKITGFEIYSMQKVEWNTRGGVEIYKWGISSHFPSEIVCLLLQYKWVLLIHYSKILRLRVLTLLQLIFELYWTKLRFDCNTKSEYFSILIWLKGTQTVRYSGIIILSFKVKHPVIRTLLGYLKLNMNWVMVGWLKTKVASSTL